MSSDPTSLKKMPTKEMGTGLDHYRLVQNGASGLYKNDAKFIWITGRGPPILYLHRFSERGMRILAFPDGLP